MTKGSEPASIASVPPQRLQSDESQQNPQPPEFLPGQGIPSDYQIFIPESPLDTETQDDHPGCNQAVRAQGADPLAPIPGDQAGPAFRGETDLHHPTRIAFAQPTLAVIGV